MTEDGKGKSPSEQPRQLDVDQHGGEIIGGPSPAEELPACGTAFWVLLEKVRELAAQSTSPNVALFDPERWLKDWIKQPQPALGGSRPEEMLDSREGIKAVRQVLGAILSGSFL